MKKLLFFACIILIYNTQASESILKAIHRHDSCDAIAQLFDNPHHQIDLNKKSSNGQLSLVEACRKGRLSVTKLLLQRGADANKQDIHGFTPLHAIISARITNKDELTNLLLDNGLTFPDPEELHGAPPSVTKVIDERRPPPLPPEPQLQKTPSASLSASDVVIHIEPPPSHVNTAPQPSPSLILRFNMYLGNRSHVMQCALGTCSCLCIGGIIGGLGVAAEAGLLGG